MGTTTGSNASALGPNEPRLPTSRDTIDQAKAAEWASLLLGELLPRPVLVPQGLPEEVQASAHSRPKTAETHERTGGATPSVNATVGSQASDTASVNQSLPSRVVLDVATATLGRLQLIVDRDPSGVRVVIGAGLDARTAISADQSQLSQVLEAAGVTVVSFRVVTPKELGTVLAQGTDKQRERDSGDERIPSPREETLRQGAKRRRLDLIG